MPIPKVVTNPIKTKNKKSFQLFFFSLLSPDNFSSFFSSIYDNDVLKLIVIYI